VAGRRPEHDSAPADRTPRRSGPRTRPAAQPPAPAPARTDTRRRRTRPERRQGKAATALRTVRPATATDAVRRDLARELLADLRRIDAGIKNNEAQTRDALAASATTLQEIPGVGAVLAAKLLGHIGDITRFPSASHFASYTGTAPLDASSGRQNRHRLNTGGNRQLNSVLHTMAVCQSRDPGPGHDYYLKKIAEGKTPREARRALKQRLSNVLYRRILHDHQHAQKTAA
jgi:transposase